MARLKGILKITGTLDGISFYESGGKTIARRSGGPSAKQMKTSRRLKRCRDNFQEFGVGAKAGKLLRITFKPLNNTSAGSNQVGYSNGIFKRIIQADNSAVPGKRQVATGLTTPAGKALLKGLHFNHLAPIAATLKAPININTATGKIEIKNLLPARDVVAPAGATHVVFKSAVAIINFTTGKTIMQAFNPVTIACTARTTNIIMSPSKMPPEKDGVTIFVVGIDFMQEINAVLYPLKNKTANVLSVIEVM